jgi:transposase
MGTRSNPQRLEEMAAQLAELRQLVATLTAENARLRAEVAALRGGAAEPGGVDGDAVSREGVPPSRKAPPRWVKANVVVVERHRPRQARQPVPGRARVVPDRQVVHAPSHCPACAGVLGRGQVVQRRQLIEVPPVRAEVVEHVVLQRRCRHCGTVSRGTMPDLSAEAGPHRRLSWAVAAQAAVLRTKLRLPLASLQWLFAHLWGLHVSEGALCALLDEAARAGQRTYEAVLADARASPVLHVDETGWRQAGRNGYVWTLSTPRERYYHYSGSRAGHVARRLVGDDYAGVVVSDFYTAYDQLDGVHQRCWAHLLRDLHELGVQHPDDAEVAAWVQTVHAIYHRAVAWSAQPQPRSPSQRTAARHACEAELLRVCRGQTASARQATLCQRLERYLPELFMFVADPAAPPTNNAAERALRPLVVARKVSGGTRSAQGSRTRMILQSLVATWELRGQNPLSELQTLLQAPRPPEPKFASL